MKIVPYKAEHLLAIEMQPAQADHSKWATPEIAAALEGTEAYTALVDGKPVACAGMVQRWEGRYEVWSYLAGGIGGKAFIKLHQAVRRFLDAQCNARIEAYVDREFDNGHRWVRSLGFEMEAPCLKRYFPNGRDAALYVRFN